ncbi:MAG TPA: AAA family ATPase [Streptosporangiaceae bacterium]
MGHIGRESPAATDPRRLIVIRGNSASGKSAVADEIRRRHGRGLAIVGQDNLRRQVLREWDVPGAANIDLIDLTARFALDRGFHVIVEGILHADHYGRMLTALIAEHADRAGAYYLDVPWAETLRRHATKPQAAEYGEREMRGWYRERDLLPGGLEQIIPAASALDETVRRIMAESGLADGGINGRKRSDCSPPGID